LTKCFEVRAVPLFNEMQCFLVDVQGNLYFQIFVPASILIKIFLIVGFESINEFLVFFLSMS
jgi:hypothetical protein